MEGFNGILLALRFGLELAAVVAVSYWGFTTRDGAAASWILGLAAPAAVVGIWWTFVAPTSPLQKAPLKLGGEILVFGGAAVALWDAGAEAIAVVFAAVAAADTLLLYVRDA